MASWGASRLHKQASRTQAAFGRWLTASTGQGFVLQWTVIGLVGIVLGICTIGAFSLPSQWAPLFVLAVLCPFIAMIVGNVRRLLLAIIILDIALQVDFHLGYRAEAAKLGTFGGWNISVTTFCLVVLYALWLGELLTRPRLKPRLDRLVRTSLPLAVYLLFVVLSVVVARDVTLSMFQIFLFLQMFLLYVYIVGTTRTRQDVLFIVAMLLIGLVVESLIMIGVYFIGQDFSITGVSTASYATGRQLRPGGTVGSPINAASYLSLLLAPAMSLWLTRLGQRYKWLAVLASALGGMALVLTGSRGGWIAFFLSIMILCLLGLRRGWLPLAVPVVVAVVVILLSLSFHDTVLTRLSSVESAQARPRLAKLAFRMIMDNPLLGVGANNFSFVLKQYATPEFGSAWLYTVHTKYLLVWAETGIGGFAAFIWFLLATIRRGWQCWKSSDRFLSPLALGFTAAIVGQMAHMFVDVFNSRPQVHGLWFVAGFITAMRNMDSEG